MEDITLWKWKVAAWAIISLEIVISNKNIATINTLIKESIGFFISTIKGTATKLIDHDKGRLKTSDAIIGVFILFICFCILFSMNNSISQSITLSIISIMALILWQIMFAIAACAILTIISLTIFIPLLVVQKSPKGALFAIGAILQIIILLFEKPT